VGLDVYKAIVVRLEYRSRKVYPTDPPYADDLAFSPFSANIFPYVLLHLSVLLYYTLHLAFLKDY
jgi:hypothetical protein